MPNHDAITVRSIITLIVEYEVRKKMCTFGGVLTEYPWISVDSFGQTNCETSQVFFVSHM